MVTSTGLVYDERYLLHDPGDLKIRYTEPYEFNETDPHPSGPTVARRTHKLLDAFGYLQTLIPIEGRLATPDKVELVHSPAMRAHVEQVSTTGGDAGYGSPMAVGGEEIARLALGGALAAVDAVMAGSVQNAFGLIRPPGHHATANESLGFCIYNNVAVAAKYAQVHHGIKRVAILDWDVHDGNGTQDIFWNDPNVLFISIHQDNLFPLDWGKRSDVGADAGAGSTINVPLPPGSGNAAYLAVIDEIVSPIMREFAPELILISAGQDASIQDPLGRMTVSVPAYREMSRRMNTLAGELCDGKLVALMEGGYSNSYAPYCTAAVIEGLMSSPPQPVPDPYAPRSEVQPGFVEVSADQRAAIDAVKAIHQQWWKL